MNEGNRAADEIDADPEVKRVVEALATGFTIRVEDLGGYDGHDYWVDKSERFRLIPPLDVLIRDGWIEGGGGSTWKLTDKGRKAYLRSTDELGDGKLYVPE
jgi:hypothetical protein